MTKAAIPISLFVFGLALGAPARAQMDFTGEWAPAYHEDAPERLPGPEIGDYMGMPINDADRLRADSYDADRISVVTEYECRPHSSDYGMRGLGDLRVTREINPTTQELVAFHTYMPAWGSVRTIWMDGRPHPPDYALHTAMGFSTGKWEGDILTVTTDHLKEGWVRRNGLARSDRAVVTEHFIRHGDQLTWVTVVNDPVYLTEPLYRSRDYVFSVAGQIAPYPCESVEEIIRPKGVIPHHLPGTNTFLKEFQQKHGIPEAAAMGGAETMYPEYRSKLVGAGVQPKK